MYFKYAKPNHHTSYMENEFNEHHIFLKTFQANIPTKNP